MLRIANRVFLLVVTVAELTKWYWIARHNQALFIFGWFDIWLMDNVIVWSMAVLLPHSWFTFHAPRSASNVPSFEIDKKKLWLWIVICVQDKVHRIASCPNWNANGWPSVDIWCSNFRLGFHLQRHLFTIFICFDFFLSLDSSQGHDLICKKANIARPVGRDAVLWCSQYVSPNSTHSQCHDDRINVACEWVQCQLSDRKSTRTWSRWINWAHFGRPSFQTYMYTGPMIDASSYPRGRGNAEMKMYSPFGHTMTK